MQTQQKYIKGSNFCFPKYTNSIYPSSVDTIGKLEVIGKITYVISQG